VDIPLKIVSAFIATAIDVSAHAPYFRDMLRGRTRPHAYTWLIWTITQGTAVAALFYGGGGWGALSLSIATLLAFLVFLFSLRFGTKNISKGDTLILITALLAVFVWWQLDHPLAAVVMVSAIDFFGYFPSIRKSFADPWSETLISWSAFSIANVFSLLALAEYNFLTMTYIITMTSANILLISICLIRRPWFKGLSGRLN
jgi:hypothetical protein